MTRKDYEALAKAIYGSLIQSGSLTDQDRFAEQHSVVVCRVAEVLERDNPRFDRELFVKACGVLPNTEKVL